MKNKTLPILLKNQKILLIGGGNVALQKAKVLHENNIDFRIISKNINDKIQKYSQNITIKKFRCKDIEDEQIIIDATGVAGVRKKLLKYKKKHHVLLNVVDQPQFCDFYFMALTKNRPLQIAVSSNGASPTAAQFFRDECEAMIPKDIQKYLQKKQKERSRGVIDVAQTKQELRQKRSKVSLVGCGIGDAELLTIKAYKTIKSADVIFYDNSINKEIIELIPQATQKEYVGKQQDLKINKRILKYLQQGLHVAYLKGGDRSVFTAGYEEFVKSQDK